ncbi:VCBS repeat-containing protein [Spirosoma arcticum]
MLSCDRTREQPLFKRLSANQTGLTFSNTITENDSVNVLNYYYCYNGGGVAIGDFNNDSLPDVFMGGNMVSSGLFLNQGKLHFDDITATAGLTTHAWIMGISVVDINNDGWLDLYLNVAGPGQANKFGNLLFINQGVGRLGIPRFKESAAAYGLANTPFSVQSAFLDYDRDGDLDMYLLTNSVNGVEKTFVYPKDYALTRGLTNDRLYRNTGTDSLGHPFYVDVSAESGIYEEGYGLGLAVDDLNNDGWPDIYAANDFMPNDHVYINQRNSHSAGPVFLESSARSQKHQSYNGMGVDIADINNDLLPDVMVVDMLPATNERRKTTIAGMNYDRFLLEKAAGYVPQFMRNTLNLNRGADAGGTTYFSDVSQLAGLHATDWSWAPLVADFDNDGLRDVYVTNGFAKNITDLDFANYQAATTMFGSNEEKQEQREDITRKLKGVKLSNYLYRNRGNLTFDDITGTGGVAIDSYSNGAAYADLDNDGDLDLVVNNINEDAYLFENLSSKSTPNHHHYLNIKIEGSTANVNGIGAKIFIYAQKLHQYAYQSPVKGYLSSMGTPLHFGLGNQAMVDSLTVTWPDGRGQTLRNVRANQQLTLRYADSQEANKPIEQPVPFFRQVNDETAIYYQHVENQHNGFSNNPLLIKQYDKAGPGIAVGEVDNKPGFDFYVGGSAGQPRTLFLQRANGTFAQKKINYAEAASEDIASLLFDADGDGDNDLYVVSGGGEFKAGDALLQDRLYANDGTGTFTRMLNALPPEHDNGSCVVGADYDRDGDIDLFVGGTCQPDSYPTPSASHLLQNQGGIFRDATQTRAPGLSQVGIVTSAVWTDFNSDGWPDLVVVGEWMPVTFYQNQRGKLVNVTNQTTLKNTRGWWNSIQPADIDNDGDVDYVVGNMGANIDYKPTPSEPIELYTDDFDRNGNNDPILSHFIRNADFKREQFAFSGRDDLFKKIPSLKKKFADYTSYSQAKLAQLIDPALLAKANHQTADRFESCIIENQGAGKFSIRPLPIEAQFSSVCGIQTGDFNYDGQTDLVITGNSYSYEVVYGWQDASLALLLLGDGRGHFSPVNPQRSGLFLKGDTKGLAILPSVSGQTLLLAPVNSDSLIVLKPTGERRSSYRLIHARPLDVRAKINYTNGTSSYHEFYYGSGYLSQSARVIKIPVNAQLIVLIDGKGNSRLLK